MITRPNILMACTATNFISINPSSRHFKTGDLGYLDSPMTLEEAQDHVEGYIEKLWSGTYHGRKFQIWVNEEGLINHMPLNFRATPFITQLSVAALFNTAFGHANGPVLILFGEACLD